MPPLTSVSLLPVIFGTRTLLSLAEVLLLTVIHFRKHMVSLRGSKFGSRVAMLCCNPSHATRPGPGTGIQLGRLNHFNEDRYSAGQSGNRFNRGSQWNPNYAPFR